MSPIKPVKRKRFGEIAVELGFMTDAQVGNILSRRNITRRMLGQLCIEEGYLDYEMLARIIAAQYSCSYASLDDLEQIDDPDLIQHFDIDYMVNNRVLPFRIWNNTFDIAVADPLDFMRVAEDISLVTELEISFVVVSEKRLTELLKNIESSRDLLDISDEMRLPIIRESDRGEYEVSVDRISSEESPVVKLVDSTLLDAINKKSSDIHIESTEKGLIIRYRIDGMLHQAAEPLELKNQGAVLSRLKVMSDLDISEKRVPQDGRFKLKVKGRFIDFRISVLPSVFGENAVIRILDQERMSVSQASLSLDDMDIPEKELLRLRRQIKAPYGMFLMTGPTGSGKTTTLYRALSEVNDKSIKVITIEDPVEYQLPGMTQIAVNHKKGLTFSKGLRSILRHDPDKILVGEIRDGETAEIAIQSALTGHQVFTTVHANTTFDVINRFMHLGIDTFNLVSALNCIVAQRLVRKLCSCKKEHKVTEKMMIESGLDPDEYKNMVFFGPAGCRLCNGTGFDGRKAILEHLELDPNLKEMILEKATLSILKKHALEKGVVFLRDAVLYDVRHGTTSLDEANRVTFIE
ncbi:Type II secretion system protein E [Desulfamplus magnetovallimortis]|uniref:Type II secretion system protein E n=1 Tax=Desulfamplus magnetovallimortis TaxID=1246637 RepID=A0A1W1H8E8_9BACT|nr:GspE/PulE family protein [Desulfamplus magnetovallimortis]SLM28655.1 Type II secretion system protein E [Desulfamplus magnetovallimortis]